MDRGRPDLHKCVNRLGLVVPVAVAIETLAGGDLFFQSYSKPYHMEFLNKKWRQNVLLPTSNHGSY